MDALGETIDENRVLFDKTDNYKPKKLDLSKHELYQDYEVDYINDLEESKELSLKINFNQVPNQRHRSTFKQTIKIENNSFEVNNDIKSILKRKRNSHTNFLDPNAEIQKVNIKNKMKMVRYDESRVKDPDAYIKKLFGKDFEFSEKYLSSDIDPQIIVKALKKRYKFK